MKNWMTRWIASALALFIITNLNIGVSVTRHDSGSLVTLGLATVAIGLANALIRPVIMFFAMPINCLTFGLFGLIVNAALFWVVGTLVPGFKVAGPVPALVGSLAMGIISGLINFLLKDRGDRDDK